MSIRLPMRFTSTIFLEPPSGPRQLRIGLQGDVSDPRTKSFLYFLDILPRLNQLPKFILLENVKGFETSSARDALIRTLKECGYKFQEFLISPTCLGIPNSRLRYFLIAKASPELFCFETTTEIMETFPSSHSAKATEVLDSVDRDFDGCRNGKLGSQPVHVGQGGNTVVFKLETARDLERKHRQDNDGSVEMLQSFLEESQDFSQYLLPPKTLLRYAILMDIVRPTCRRSVCFTKGYGHYVEGTGSVLQTCLDTEIETAFRSLDMLSDEEKLKQLSMLKLRYFTPREIANLLGFPADFCFPEKTSTKQQYRLLGNSLNAHVVARLLKLLVA
ncbi:tRNA (cytosine(38)-C(5))-methyltransferase isoform X2 [Amia ocellicauda]|uniref:tRNA (cytosine(38)-C(5))-methyltransferase isoform X2 n=1 Tax=Amia ocellicauda TaxID=2972642 RepID=UPI0034645281